MASEFSEFLTLFLSLLKMLHNCENILSLIDVPIIKMNEIKNINKVLFRL